MASMRRWAKAVVLGLGVATATGCAHDSPRASLDPGADEAHAQLVWSPWSRETFTSARDDGRIILVNVVATWCHWCHVMEETTYEDPEVVALLREHFVTIRVDSDARPDVAERYRDWGWPATGFLTPDARPVLELRGYQNPRAFAALLRGLVADRERGALRHREAPPPSPSTGQLALDAIRTRAAAQLDGFYEPPLGGWSRAQRYPSPGPIEHAWVRARIDDDAASATQATTTLASAKKLIDPVFGGMYQYSEQGDWDHPHYEKITAIQAGAIRNYAFAYRATGDAGWLAAAREVARYMTTMMRSPEGDFFTSQDADLRIPGKPAILGERYYGQDAEGRRAMGLPRIDDGVYADLNGMMIEAMCDLYAAGGDREDLAVAERAARRVLETHANPDGGLRHGATDTGTVLHLRDQVAMGRGLLALYRTTGEPTWLDHAERVAAFMLASLEDRDRGGFFAHTVDPDAFGVFAERRRPLEENGTAARFLALLHRHRDGDGTTQTPYLAAAERALTSLGTPEAVAAEGRIIGQFLLGLQEVTMPTVDITVVGELGGSAGATTAALHAAALRYPEPRAVIELSRPGERYPDIGKPAVYLCTPVACSSPITDPGRFAALADAFVRSSLPARSATRTAP